MILKILPHTRQIYQFLHTSGVEYICASDPGELEELWALNRAGREDDFL
jgi:hypothetical protein